jgi:hypothetical protein
MTVGLTQEAQRAAYRQLLNDCGRSVRIRSGLKKRIDSALRIQVLGFLRPPNLRLERICALLFSHGGHGEHEEQGEEKNG